MTVAVAPPAEADFVGEPIDGMAPLTVVFEDQSTGNPTHWFWQFGDGGVSTEQNPTHVYMAPGSYTVTLTVNNDDGTMSKTVVDYITVTAGPPIANFVATPISGTVPLAVTFSDLSLGEVTERIWDFGDGSENPVTLSATVVHTYMVAGTYTVTLTVSNSFGSDTATGTVTVLNSVADTAKVVRRINYRFGGQVVATRVEAEDENGQLIDNEAFTGLFYVHSDHLGSATALSYGQDRTDLQGTLVPDSVARFLPFGEYRGAKPQTNPAVSDRGFTGHKHNDSLGLVYMNARYYVPYINRFLSPDTLVPDPMNPQQFNRYTYSLNNPVNFVDPSGHRSCTAEQAASGDETCNQNTSSSIGSNAGELAYLLKYPVCTQTTCIGHSFLIPSVYVSSLPTASVSPGRAFTAKILNGAGIGLSWGELAISAAGVAGEPIAAIGGFVAGGPVGAVGALMAERGVLDFIETMVSLFTAQLTTSADILSGNAFVDWETNELVISSSIIKEALENSVDFAVPASPEVDFALNSSSLLYDIPDFFANDQYQLRVSLNPSKSSAPVYFVYAPYANIYNQTYIPRQYR